MLFRSEKLRYLAESGVDYVLCVILSDPLGRPVLTLSGPARERADALGATTWHVSITHGRTTAAAVVVLEGKMPPAARRD